MRRRDFITLISGAGAWPLAARAQRSQNISRIGFLASYTAEGGKGLVGCFRKGLEQFGWVEGQNLTIEYRWAEGRIEQFPVLAAELSHLRLDLIASNSTPAAQALKRATNDIPIVFMAVSDPVASNIVRSLARPEGNITGVSNFLPATTGKLLDLLLSMLPRASRVAVILTPDNPGKILELKEIEAAAKTLGVVIETFEVRGVEDIDSAFAGIAKARVDALIVFVDYVTLSNREQIMQLVSQGRWPSIFQVRDFVDAGGLMSYGLNLCNHFRQAAAHVDKILKGRKPADLPVELPTTFELIINRSTAKTLGLAIPDKLIALADEVIE